MSGFDDLESALQGRKTAHLYRQRRLLESAQQPVVRVDGCEYIGFCSNDYLGLANHPEVISAFQQAANDYGVGSGASHLVLGHSSLHHQLEEALAEFTGRPRALLFSTGYMANLGAVNGLLRKSDAVLEDRLNHASLLDAGLLSGARFQRYHHNDAEHLGKRLEKLDAKRQLVVTDGVFSMDGDVADLPRLSEACQSRQAWLMVDDAHGFGVLGHTGGGCVEHFGLSLSEVPVLVGTLGKAFGTSGAFVAGSDALIETLIQQARTYIYTTAMPPAVAAASLASLKLVIQGQDRREKLGELIQQFRRGVEQLGFQLMASDTPIQPLLIGDEATVLAYSAALERQGFFVSAIRPPTVPAGTARLRVTLTASHSAVQVERLLLALEQAQQEVAK